MTDNPPSERVLHQFMDNVEQLCDRVEELHSQHDRWQNKVQSCILQVEELEEENNDLAEQLQSLKLEFSDMAGQMETRLKRIKQQAEQLRQES